VVRLVDKTPFVGVAQQHIVEAWYKDGFRRRPVRRKPAQLVDILR